MLGSNFSSSADEPQIPHGEILIPFFFFNAQLKTQVSDWGIIPPFFWTSFSTQKYNFCTLNQAVLLKEGNSAFSHNCTLYMQSFSLFCTGCSCMEFLGILLHPHYLMADLHLILSCHLSSAQRSTFLEFLQSLYDMSTTENTFKSPLFSCCCLTSGTAFLCIF